MPDHGMAISTENVMNDRRIGPRHRTQKTGIITFQGSGGIHRNGNVNCRVCNLSPTGARLEVASQIGIPDHFMLWIEFDELKLPCHVSWRTVMSVRSLRARCRVAVGCFAILIPFC